MPSSRVSNSPNTLERRAPRNRSRWWRRLGLGVLIGALLLATGVAALPSLLTRPATLNWLLARVSQQLPLQLKLSQLRVGWWQPVELQQLLISDPQGEEWLRVEQLSSDHGLLGWLRWKGDLGRIRLSNVQLTVDVQPGATNIERVIGNLLDKLHDPQAADSTEATSPMIGGELLIEELRILALPGPGQDGWQLHFPRIELSLPSNIETPLQVQLSGSLTRWPQPLASQAVGGGEAIGRLQIEVTGTLKEGGWAVQIAATELPLEMWELVGRRFPDLPVEQLGGKLSTRCRFELGTGWKLDIDELTIRELAIDAPSLLGARGGELASTQLSGELRLEDDQLTLRQLDLQCDVARLAGQLDMSLSAPLPSLQEPWLHESQLEVNGQVDMSRLIAAFPDLVPMQPETSLIDGRLTLVANQRLGSDGRPTASADLKLGRLVADVAGRRVVWESPLSTTVRVRPDAEGEPELTARCQSEFLQLDAIGGPRAGTLDALLDLERLHQRLSDWIQLPVSSMSGTAKTTADWQISADHLLAAQGRLETTRIRLEGPGGMTEEPAWQGRIDVHARLDGGVPVQLDSLEAKLSADGELLEVTVLEPIALWNAEAGQEQLPLAQARLQLTGNLEGWQRRIQLLVPMEVDARLDGNCQLEAVGGLDRSRFELTRANWEVKPLRIQFDQLRLHEPLVRGEFRGRIDTADISRLVIERLLVQAESFALQAQDQARGADEPPGRLGQAAFQVDLGRLTESVQGLTSSPGDSAAAVTYLQGNLRSRSVRWQSDPQGIDFEFDVGGQDIALFQRLPIGPPTRLTSGRQESRPVSESRLWLEPRLDWQGNGRLETADDRLQLSSTQLQTDWLTLLARVDIEQLSSEGRRLRIEGDSSYDAEGISSRLAEWTGQLVRLKGRREAPISLTWQMGSAEHWSDGLSAELEVGWEAAWVAGLEVGPTSVPLQLTGGVLASRAELPLAQGRMRWDMQADLQSEPMQVRLAPGQVLDEVTITPELCHQWLKYITPIVAEATRVEGTLSLQLDEALLIPSAPDQQTVVGRLSIRQVRVGPGPLTNELQQLVSQIRLLRQGSPLGTPDPNAGRIPWVNLSPQTIPFEMRQGRIVHRDLRVELGDVQIVSNGAVDLNGQLDMLLQVPIRPEWVSERPVLSRLAGQTIDIPVRGNFQRPRPDFAGLTQVGAQLLERAAEGFLQQQLERGLNRLLGNPGNRP